MKMNCNENTYQRKKKPDKIWLCIFSLVIGEDPYTTSPTRFILLNVSLYRCHLWTSMRRWVTEMSEASVFVDFPWLQGYWLQIGTVNSIPLPIVVRLLMLVASR